MGRYILTDTASKLVEPASLLDTFAKFELRDQGGASIGDEGVRCRSNDEQIGEADTALYGDRLLSANIYEHFEDLCHV
ncbi:MAG: hypothetical protein GY759_20055 [Chloroflexi bacterium]|nr:hypothetical protein [Chloroflexota bacterium]